MPYRLVPRVVRNYLGKRGLILFLFGLAWVIQALAIFVYGGGGNPAPFWHEHLPTVVLGGLWAASGVASVVVSFFKKHANDTAGFIAVSFMPMLLAVSYGIGSVTRALVGDPTWLLGLLGFSIWGVITLALGVIAAWPEDGEA